MLSLVNRQSASNQRAVLLNEFNDINYYFYIAEDRKLVDELK